MAAGQLELKLALLKAETKLYSPLDTRVQQIMEGCTAIVAEVARLPPLRNIRYACRVLCGICRNRQEPLSVRSLFWLRKYGCGDTLVCQHIAWLLFC